MSPKTFANTKPKPREKPTEEVVVSRGLLKAHSESKKAPKVVKGNKKEKQAQNKVTVYFSDQELAKIKDKAGIVPLARYVRHLLNEAGHFDN